ncbi:rod shape-determining protein MreC [Aliidiomarina iranensis]|uniref:Cell shape-determining protein MreC n=1 Tax=Aliidiomarina iranensis TaxID=1434071 RepID=A0A432W2T8_9GAMM|nr:rod shape-determining protein MreC [Aliidiomarina iranensis]RUO23473.1 rod shape-determining protein MreC [Aliidiomarina iranensis]
MSSTLFIQRVSLRTRLTLALLLAFLLIFADHQLEIMQPVRGALNSVVSPVQYLAVMPEQGLDNFINQVQSRRRLVRENQQLKEDVLSLQGQMQRYQFLVRENERLRGLLASESREERMRMVAEVIAVDSDPFSHQVVVNKGTRNGVYIGQPVIDAEGVIGQVVDVGLTTARVILVSDQSHAIPLRAEASGIRVIAQGVGDTNSIELMHVPHSTELSEGDLLMTSGLGGVFPEGYPVARISNILRDESLPFAQVQATPVANLDRIRMLLLLWDSNSELQPIRTENEPPSADESGNEGANESGNESVDKSANESMEESADSEPGTAEPETTQGEGV